MKKMNFLILILACLLNFGSLTAVKAQDEMPPDTSNQNINNAQTRPNLLRELGLTQVQLKRIRQINQERRPQIRAAQERLREANRNLDQAIYADTADDAEIQVRLKEVQTAQSEVIKLRSLTELAVRKNLTPEQLAKFRDVREQFMERKENILERKKNRSVNAPNRQLNNRRQLKRSGN